MSGRLRDLASVSHAMANGLIDDLGRARARWRDAQAARFQRDHADPIAEQLLQLSEALAKSDEAMSRLNMLD